MNSKYYMNKRTGKAYAVVTGKRQTRNRLQLVSMSDESTARIVRTRLVPLTLAEAIICRGAEKIIRGKHKRSETESLMVKMYRIIQEDCRD